jgi:hypothetical protein
LMKLRSVWIKDFTSATAGSSKNSCISMTHDSELRYSRAVRTHRLAGKVDMQTACKRRGALVTVMAVIYAKISLHTHVKISSSCEKSINHGTCGVESGGKPSVGPMSITAMHRSSIVLRLPWSSATPNRIPILKVSPHVNKSLVG